MKSKKIIGLILVFLMMIVTLNINTYARTLPELIVTSNHYSSGDKITLEEVNNVQLDKTLQLYAIIGYGNDLPDPELPDSSGWYVQQADLSGVTWTSSNNSIATVDSNGKVTGVAEGKTTITAKYNNQAASNETANYEVNVIPRTSFHVSLKVGSEGGHITSEQGLATYVEKGNNLKVYICPEEGYEIDKVLVDDEAIDLSSLVYEKNNPNAASEDGVAVYTFTNVDKDHTIEAHYKKKPDSERTSFYVALRVGSEGGHITSEQGLATYVEKGNNLKVYICPEEGYEIDKVLVDDEAIDLSSLVYEKNNPNAASEDGVAVYTIKNINKDYTIEAYYKKKSSSEPTKQSSSDITTTKDDPTTSPTILPKTGDNAIIIIIGIILIVAISMIMYKKYKN